jgi:hypothetical protein
MARSVAVLAAVLALAGCEIGDVGYVEIRAVPSSALAQPALYLDSDRLEPLKGGVAVLRHRVGITKLRIEGAGGELNVLCNVSVKKNRITTVTLSVLSRPPRCQCTRGDPNEPSQTCLS